MKLPPAEVRPVLARMAAKKRGKVKKVAETLLEEIRDRA
jgi:hypothetical protein